MPLRLLRAVRKDRRSAAVAEPQAQPAPLTPAEQALARADELVAAHNCLGAIDVLTAANRELADPAIDARLLQVRHDAFGEVSKEPVHQEWPAQDADRFPGITSLPEVRADELDAAALRSAVLHHGALIVRGLYAPEAAARLVGQIDAAVESYERQTAGEEEPVAGGHYVPYEQPGADNLRRWVYDAGGVLAVEAPRAFNELIERYEEIGLRETITGFLGERPALSARKSTLRRVPVDLGHADWHQDGAFLGSEIRAVNVWVALTPCGGDLPSPGLNVVPQRLDLLPTGTHGAWFEWSVSPDILTERGIEYERPLFAAGDAVLFDERFLHRSALDPDMTDPRYAIESWFFAPSSYPGHHHPIVF